MGIKPRGDKIRKSAADATNLSAAIDAKADLVAGKVPISQIPDSLVGQVEYQTTWNPATNTPTLVDPTNSTTKGHYYVCSASGGRFGINFNVGDWCISNGTNWQKVDNTDAVISVNGTVGSVIVNLANIPGSWWDNSSLQAAISAASNHTVLYRVDDGEEPSLFYDGNEQGWVINDARNFFENTLSQLADQDMDSAEWLLGLDVGGEARIIGISGFARENDAYIREQIWSTPGTYSFTFPTWAKYCDLLIIGGGQSGGSGCKRASGTATSGGVGGCPGQYLRYEKVPVSLFGYAALAVQVGTGGAAVAGVSTDNTDGNQVNNGTLSKFSDVANFTANVSTTPATVAGTSGVSATAAVASVNNGSAATNGGGTASVGAVGAAQAFSGGAATTLRSLGGASGGGISATPAAFNGGALSSLASLFSPAPSAGVVGGAAPSAGYWITALEIGLSGGGGASSITGSGQDAGITPSNAFGAGGSGGGSCLNGASRISGAGSRGGNGFVRVRYYA
jgi:hypothetical protein